jgi:hypothetical protein
MPCHPLQIPMVPRGFWVLHVPLLGGPTLPQTAFYIGSEEVALGYGYHAQGYLLDTVDTLGPMGADLPSFIASDHSCAPIGVELIFQPSSGCNQGRCPPSLPSGWQPCSHPLQRSCGSWQGTTRTVASWLAGRTSVSPGSLCTPPE